MSEFETVEYLEVLDPAECLQLLAGRGVGRIGGIVRGRPLILPINFAVLDEGIVFRTRRGGDIDQFMRSAAVAFEVDESDTIYHEGWSVVVVGRCAEVSDPAELHRVRRLRLLPWAGGSRDLFLHISIDEICGRRIVHRET